jgi:polysaccharide export outer membrane protein
MGRCSSPGWSWAGSEQRKTALLSVLTLAVALACLPAQVRAASPDAETVDLAFGVPAPAAAEVQVTLGEGVVTLDLPAQARVPADLVGVSLGLLRGGTAIPQEDGHLRLDLRLASGTLESVIFRPDAVVLRFRRAGSSSIAETDSYRLGAEDKILISVNGHPEMSRDMVVTQTGMIAAPLLGELQAAGLRPDQLAGRIAEGLGRDYLVDPKVDVQVLEYKSQWAVVSGEVRNPGRVSLRGGTDLKEVIAVAGGFGPDAGERITLSHGDPGTPHTDARVVARGAFERGEENPRVRHGDIVNVERAAYCYLNGEVRLPGKQRIERGMTLLRAISQAGGLTEWANRKAVHVMSEGEGKAPVLYDLREIEKGKIPDPELRGGEVVTVRRRFL